MGLSKTGFKLKIVNFNPQMSNELKIKIYVNLERGKPGALAENRKLYGAVSVRQKKR